jgi:hypothetical protein
MLVKMSLLLLATLITLGAQTRPPAKSAPKSSASEIPTVSLCALLSKPADYHDKEVRVRARYHIGFEYSYLDDSSCKDYAAETTPYRTGNVVWAEFDRSVEAKTEPEVYREFKESASLCCPAGWRDTQAELVVTGMFFKAGVEGYGHLGRYAMKVAVSKIEEVNATERSNQ